MGRKLKYFNSTDFSIVKRLSFHPISSASWTVLLDKYREHRPFHKASRLQRILALGSSFVRQPFYLLEKLIYQDRLANQEIESGPIFIIGHWRSGTTHLHNILSQDEQFAYLSFSNMVMPHDLLIGRYFPIIPLILKTILPKTRGIDQLPLKPHLPQEEELALGMLEGVSYYNCYFFPQDWDDYFAESIATEKFDDDHLCYGVARAYETLLKKLTIINKGKQLILKNPASTSRIAMLKMLFPKAKFVHVRRNPYAVFASSRARLPQMVNAFSWNDEPDLDFDKITLESYSHLMKRYLEQRDSIPSDDLFETSYEELVADPEKVINEIYSKFNLERNAESRQRHDQYLKSQKAYQKNDHKLTRLQIERIQSEWAFALKEWDYEMPSDLEIKD